MKFAFQLSFISLIAFSFSAPSYACSSMASPEAWAPGFAHNFDWPTVMTNLEGGFTLSKRGIRKKGVLFGATSNLAEWTSKYASVAFSVTGPEYPASGINEKGLIMITQALPETEFPDLKDPRPTLNTTQFVQYNLDKSESIDEVIASDKLLRPFSAAFKVHFFVCDANRNCAVLQYIKGKLIVYKGADLPYPVITNHPYPESVKSVETCSSQGCSEKDNSLWRFAELAYWRKQVSTSVNLEIAFWPVLDKVAQLESTSVATRFQVVYNPTHKKIYARHWKTKKTMMLEYDFSKMDCDQSDPLKNKIYLRIDPRLDGDQTHRFEAISLQRRAELAEKAGLPMAQAKEMAAEALTFTCQN